MYEVSNKDRMIIRAVHRARLGDAMDMYELHIHGGLRLYYDTETRAALKATVSGSEKISLTCSEESQIRLAIKKHKYEEIKKLSDQLDGFQVYIQ